MKRSAIYIFSLLLCMAMLLCAVPIGNAEALEGKRYPQMRTLTTGETGEITFTLPEELVTLAQQAANAPDQVFSCSYAGSDVLTVSSDLTIPKNMYVYAYTAPDNRVLIPSGFTLAVEGFFGAGQLDIQGKLNVAKNAAAAVSQSVNIVGQLNLEGTLRMLSGLETQLSGADKIQYGNQGYVWFRCAYANEADIREIFSAAVASNSNWYYDCYNSVTAIELTSPLTVPFNCFLCADLCEEGETVTFTGAPTTVVGEIDVYTTTVIQNDLIVDVEGNIYAASMFPQSALTLQGTVINDGYVDAYCPVIFQNKVENYGALDVWYDDGGCLTFDKPERYYDDNGEALGVIWVDSADVQFPVDAIVGMNRSDFGKVTYEDGTQAGVMPYWGLWEYIPTAPAQPEKEVTVPMYRLYNPNTGEHFYTGSLQERNMLVEHGWQYEGVAWNAPTKSGEPVYRLYNPNNGDHHYTMSQEERDMLVGFGWQYEGVAWNSAPANGTDVTPLYRLYNPNADCGSHHYTGSEEERDFLVSLGWHYEGIGWFGIR